MANWFYYNENGEKIQVTGDQLKGLAKAGLITPETIVETEEGKTARAGKVKGLTFPDTLSIDEDNIATPITEETCNVVPPSTISTPLPPPVQCFDIILEDYEVSKKVAIIKVIKNATGGGLAETKTLVESKPCIIKTGISQVEAEKLKNELERNGAKISIVSGTTLIGTTNTTSDEQDKWFDKWFWWLKGAPLAFLLMGLWYGNWFFVAIALGIFALMVCAVLVQEGIIGSPFLLSRTFLRMVLSDKP